MKEIVFKSLAELKEAASSIDMPLMIIGVEGAPLPVVSDIVLKMNSDVSSVHTDDLVGASEEEMKKPDVVIGWSDQLVKIADALRFSYVGTDDNPLLSLLWVEPTYEQWKKAGSESVAHSKHPAALAAAKGVPVAKKSPSEFRKFIKSKFSLVMGKVKPTTVYIFAAGEEKDEVNQVKNN